MPYKIQTVFLQEIEPNKIIELMNNKMVARYLPLLKGDFSEHDCQAFVAAKKKLWEYYGYGPWAFLVDGEFAGWGGLQPEQGEADFALILHPNYWGLGREIFKLVKDKAFNELGLDSIMALLPPNRHNANAILRFGFKEEGQLNIGGQDFRKFRYLKP